MVMNAAAGQAASDRDEFIRRIAAVQQQLQQDLAATHDLFADDDDDQERDLALEHTMLFTLEESTAAVLDRVKRLPFVTEAEDANGAVVRAQIMVTLLSNYALSVTPPDVVDALGRDAYFGIQGLHMDHLQRALEAHGEDGGRFHRDIVETEGQDFLELMLGIVSAPLKEHLGVELDRDNLLADLLVREPFGLSRLQGNSLQVEARAINKTWLDRLRDLEREAQQKAQGADGTGGTHGKHGALASGTASSAPAAEPLFTDYLASLTLDRADAERIHAATHIPPKKLAKALACRRFASDRAPAEVFLLVDDTAFQGGAEGLLVTDQYISFKSLFEDSVDYHYARGWNGEFTARDTTVTRFGDTCKRFSLISASGVQQLVWALNRFFADRFQWHLSRAGQGDADAQFYLANSCADDADQALCWLTAAAQNGHVSAQHNLGVHYLSRDPRLAYKWLSQAAAQGSVPARARLDSDQFSNFR